MTISTLLTSDKIFMAYFLNLLVYSVTLVLIFTTLALGYLKNLKSLSTLSKLNATHFFKFAVLIGFLSLSGLPPFLGFFAKLFLFFILVNKSNFILVLLFLFFNLFALYFYLQATRHLSYAGLRKNTKITLTKLTINNKVSNMWLFTAWSLSLGFFFLEPLVIYLCNIFA